MPISTSPYLFPDACIAVFAREPVAGAVKTRLIPALGAASALALYEAMATRTLALVSGGMLAPRALWVASNPSHEFFVTLCNEKEIHLQTGQSLGDKMYNCATATLAQDGRDSVVIIGTDCPALTVDYLQRALDALHTGSDVVLGPASDGGYVLIGLRQPWPELFRGIAWGTSTVLAQTLGKINAMNLSSTVLETLWDVDEAPDLLRLSTLDPPLAWP